MQTIENHPNFFTATIYEWIRVLEFEETKEIVLNSLSFLVKNKRAKVFAFVIMDNHIHLIWQVLDGHEVADVQRDFLKYSLWRKRPLVLPLLVLSPTSGTKVRA